MSVITSCDAFGVCSLGSAAELNDSKESLGETGAMAKGRAIYKPKH